MYNKEKEYKKKRKKEAHPTKGMDTFHSPIIINIGGAR